MLILVFVDVVLKSEEKSLRMFGSHDDPVADFRLLNAREHCGKVYHELAVRMSDDSKV